MIKNQSRRPSSRPRRPALPSRRRKVYQFIINKSVGTGKDDPGLKLAKKLERRLKRSGWDSFIKTANTADEFDRCITTAIREQPFAVVVFGGDGSVRRAAAQVAKVNGLLGIVPTGRHNNIYNSLYGPVDVEAALELIGAGYQARIDLGQANGRVFVGSLITGLVPALIESLGGGKFPRLGMTWSKLAGRAADDIVPKAITMKIDYFTFQLEPHLLNVHLLPNLLTLRFAPIATPDNSKLVVIYDRDASRDVLAHYIRDLKKGSYQYTDAMQIIRGQKIVITPASGQKWLMDGDEMEFSGEELIIEVLPGALRVFSHAPKKQ